MIAPDRNSPSEAGLARDRRAAAMAEYSESQFGGRLRHRQERSDEAIHMLVSALDCFASPAMTMPHITHPPPELDAGGRFA